LAVADLEFHRKGHKAHRENGSGKALAVLANAGKLSEEGHHSMKPQVLRVDYLTTVEPTTQIQAL